jgi:hypothetical protein
MKVKTDVLIEKLKKSVQQWDLAFDKFQVKEYPMRLLAQVQYREQMKVLISMRLLVEERLLNFNQRIN